MNDDLIRGSGNVFRDVGEPDADKKHARVLLAVALIGEMDRLGLDSATLRDLRDLRRLNNIGKFTDERLFGPPTGRGWTMVDSLSRYMDELANHTADDAEYRAIIAKRVRDKMEELRANDNEPKDQ